MPRITRYFPVSHDINSDHEVWEMRDTIGEKSLSIWLELLSIADRNDGELPVNCQPLLKSLAYRCRTTAKLVSMVWQWGIEHSWIVCQPTPRLRSYAKFHRIREPLVPPIGALLPKRPKHPKQTIKSAHKCACPPDFKVTEEIHQWAKEKGFPDPDLQLESFRDYHVSKGSRFTDWTAAFRNWIRKSAEFSKEPEDDLYAAWKPCTICHGEHRPGFCPMGE